jgi:hypothetical protein
MYPYHGVRTTTGSVELYIADRYIGYWQSLIFYPADDYGPGVPIALMRYLIEFWTPQDDA